MRAVALADGTVQDKVGKSFIPLKVMIAHGTKEFPLDWPAMRQWSAVYRKMGGEKCEGITACAVVSPDLKVELGNTGSAFVWELFDSIAYDAKKFAAMLDRSGERWARQKGILADKGLSEKDREGKLASFHAEIRRAIEAEGQFQLPPKGFTISNALELFELSGDLKKK